MGGSPAFCSVILLCTVYWGRGDSASPGYYFFGKDPLEPRIVLKVAPRLQFWYKFIYHIYLWIFSLPLLFILKKDQKDFLMYKRCFLHIMPSPPPTHPHTPFFSFPALNSKTSAPVSRATISSKEVLPLVCPKGGERSSGGTRLEAQSAGWPGTSLTHSGQCEPSSRPHGQSPLPIPTSPSHSHADLISGATQPPMRGGGNRESVPGDSFSDSALHPFGQKVPKLQG